MQTELAEAADTYLAAPGALQDAIVRAAAAGEKAPAIFLAIKQAYSIDYVRQIIGEARKAGRLPPREAKS
jgi:hypothetical protein